MNAALIFAAMIVGGEPNADIASEPACASNIFAMTSQLAEHYGELPLGAGEDRDSGGTVLYVRPDKKSWTLVFYETPDTLACIVGSGTNWQAAPEGQGL